MKKTKSQKSLIGIIARGEIAKGHSDEQALATVWANVPECETTIACIQWYRWKMRRQGNPVPTSAEAALMVMNRRRTAEPASRPRKPRQIAAQDRRQRMRRAA